MNIVIISSSYKPNIGGVEELTSKLCVAYNDKGHDSCVATSQWPASLSNHEIIDDVEINRFNFILPSTNIVSILKFITIFPITFIKFCNYLKRMNPDIVNIQCASSNGFYALLAKRILKFKLVVTLQGETVMDDYDIYNKSSILRWTLRKLMKEAEWVTANSNYTLNDAIERFGGDRSKCSVIYNGVDLGEFKGTEPYEHSKPYIYATGRLVYKKGFDLLIKAFSKIADKYKDIDLLISGKGDYEEELTLIIKTLGLEDRVKLLGPADRKMNVSLFKGCDFFVMPSRLEPFGIVCLEAMAAGKPIIFTNNGGTKEFVNNTFGIKINTENINEFKGALETLLSDVIKCKEMGRIANEEVQKFNWAQITEEYLVIYERIVKNNEK